MFLQFFIITASKAKINTAEAKGIIFSVIDAIRFTPPKIIIPVIAASPIPTASGATFSSVHSAEAIALDCVILPIPSDAAMQNTEKMQAGLRLENAFSMYVIEPPSHSFCSFFTLYSMPSIFSAQQVISPSIADIIIQNTAPGPPALSAAATPIMLPVPIQAASDDDNAASGEMPSCVLFLPTFPKVERNISKGCRN